MFIDFFAFVIIFLGYVIPLYFANASPIILHGKIPLDLNFKFNNKRILGDGKSILGTLFGIISGTVAGFIYFFLSPVSILIPNYLLLAFILAAGGIFGDIFESFIKRRLGIKRGEQWLVFDQIDFVFGGLILSLFIRVPEIEIILAILFITFFAHKFSNTIAYKLKLKKVPW